ncbi:MAG TPA: ATP-binding protein [Candidatus Paceibacterota bacterium]|nr:ATP-binding protein [Candidatus Paceibacterota bacterium]
MVPIDIHENEKVLLKLRKHWIILVRDIVATVILGILPFILFGIIGLTVPIPFDLSALIPFGALLSALWLLAIWLTLAVLWTNYYLDLWAVTDQRIISVDQINLFNRKVTTLDLEKIQEISVRTENIFETFLHFGTVTIETASPENDVRMEGIPHPEQIRTRILEQANHFRQLLDDNESKKQLLHMVSHEVKNYLAKDAAALAEIAEGSFDRHPGMVKSVASQALSETRKGVKAMMDLLQGETTIEMQPFDLAATVRDMARGYEVAARKKALSFNVDASSPCVVRGDAEKMSRLVIKNLLDNALNYTPGGSIAVAVEKNASVVRLTVADTGVGLSPEDMERLFTPGGKGAESSSINPESTGYGLAIAKQVVEAQGGRIWAESEGPGKGSTFIVELPVTY